MIRFEQVTKYYPSPNNCQALSKVSFQVGHGEMVFINGHSGAGKSTLLKLMTMTEYCDEGKILIANKDISQIPAKYIPYWRRSIGIVYQTPQLLFDRNVFDNVALPLLIEGTQMRIIRRRVGAALEKVGLLGKEKCYPHTLSGGEQQRLGIGRAVVNKPSVLLADEPTGNLDPNLSFSIMRLFEQFSQLGVTVMIVSHDLPLILRMERRMLTLRQGCLVNDGMGC